MAASKDYTALAFFQRAWARIQRVNSIITVPDWDIWALVNEVCPIIQGALSDIFSEIYLRETALVSMVGKYYTANASWVAATKQLTATMNAAFDASDVGALITFNQAANTYAGTITSVISGTTVVVQGTVPAGNTAVSYVMSIPTAVANDQVSIAALRILNTGAQIKTQLLSSLTTTVDIVSPLKLPKFRSTDAWNSTRIVYAVVGSVLKLGKGGGLASYGVLTYQYPHVCDPVTADTDYVDLPDGGAINLGILKLANLMAGKVNVNLPDPRAEMEAELKQLYNARAGELNTEVQKEKILALL